VVGICIDGAEIVAHRAGIGCRVSTKKDVIATGDSNEASGLAGARKLYSEFHVVATLVLTTYQPWLKVLVQSRHGTFPRLRRSCPLAYLWVSTVLAAIFKDVTQTTIYGFAGEASYYWAVGYRK
jgi:hypothetical protein